MFKLGHLFKKHRETDPVFNCYVYLRHGCSHVDGLLCDFDTCKIRLDWLKEEQEQIIEQAEKDYMGLYYKKKRGA